MPVIVHTVPRLGLHQSQFLPLDLDTQTPYYDNIVGVIVGIHPLALKSNISMTGTPSANKTIGGGEFGECRRILTDNTTEAWVYPGAWSRIAPPWSILSMYRLPTVPASGTRATGNYTSNTFGYGITPNSSNFRFQTARSGASTTLTGLAVNTKIQVDVGVSDATNNFYYQRGAAVVTGAHGGIVTPTGDFRVGADNVPNFGVIMEHYLSVLWNVALPEGYIRHLQNNPWTIFEPERHQVYYVSAAATAKPWHYYAQQRAA